MVDEAAAQDAKEVKAILTITLYADESVRVEGPVGNKMVAYGMLQCAHDAIFENALGKRKIESGNGNGNSHKILDFIRRK